MNEAQFGVGVTGSRPKAVSSQGDRAARWRSGRIQVLLDRYRAVDLADGHDQQPREGDEPYQPAPSSIAG
jgi:hypothetical protein